MIVNRGEYPTCSDEHNVFTRTAEDRSAPDHYGRFRPILIATYQVSASRRRGGSRTHSPSALGASLIETGTIKPATAVFSPRVRQSRIS